MFRLDCNLNRFSSILVFTYLPVRRHPLLLQLVWHTSSLDFTKNLKFLVKVVLLDDGLFRLICHFE